MQKNTMKKNATGFTLVELILVIAIFSIIIASITSFFVLVIRGKGKSVTRVEAQEQARIAMNRMTYEIKRSTSASSSSKFDVNIATTSTSTFILVSSVSARNPTVFNVSNGILYMKYGTSASVALTSKDVSISNLMFSKYASTNGRSNGIVVSMTVYKADASGQTANDVYYPLETAVEISGK